MAIKEDRIEYKRRGHKVNIKSYTAEKSTRHWHSTYELEFVSSGQGDLLINGKRHDFRRGCIYLLRLKDYHERSLSHSGIVYKIQIPDQCMPKSFLRFLISYKGNLITYLDDYTALQIENLYLLLMSCKGNNSDTDFLKKSIINVIYLLFLGSLKANPADYVKSSHEKVLDAQLYMKDHLREHISVSDIASAVGMNKNYLGEIFKKEVGVSLYAYLKQVRLEEARRLALNTRLKSQELCDAVGYSSYSNFLRDFKEAYGVSPLQLRKNESTKP